MGNKRKLRRITLRCPHQFFGFIAGGVVVILRNNIHHRSNKVQSILVISDFGGIINVNNLGEFSGLGIIKCSNSDPI